MASIRKTTYLTKHATSAGGLVYDDRDDGRWVVLIAHETTGGDVLWTLPKGGIDDGETLVETAVREVREETGLDTQVRAKLGVIDYWFVWRPDKVRYHKYVHYFLLNYVGGDFSRRDEEAFDVVWLPIDQAIARMSHPNEVRLVRKAMDTFGPEVGRSPSPPAQLLPLEARIARDDKPRRVS